MSTTKAGAEALAGMVADSAVLNTSLRDLFAAFALAGMMAGKDVGETNPRWAAAKAYDLADAMLDQRLATTTKRG